ncbi:MAG: hypothetical protein MZU97_10335 [Bacillus subtilis]|nr:hypothetical protein [Bacillus subtilis]
MTGRYLCLMCVAATVRPAGSDLRLGQPAAAGSRGCLLGRVRGRRSAYAYSGPFCDRRTRSIRSNRCARSTQFLERPSIERRRVLPRLRGFVRASTSNSSTSTG